MQKFNSYEHLLDKKIKKMNLSHYGEQPYFNSNNSLFPSFTDNDTPSTTRERIDFKRKKNWPERILVEMTGLLHVLSPTGKILYCSESTFALTGFRPHELVGHSLMDFLHVDDMDVFIRDFQISFHTQSQIKTYYRFRKKDDSYIIFETVGQPKSTDSSAQAFFGTAQPVPSKSGIMIDSFLELKAENNWLRKRIRELSAKGGEVTGIPEQHNVELSNQKYMNDTIVTPSSSDNKGFVVGEDNQHLSELNRFIISRHSEEHSSIPSEEKEISEDVENVSLSHMDTSEVKKRWKRRKKYKEKEEYVCTDCGTTTSPEWRKGPHGPKT
ncbi:uncharacterized protein BX663DRAFT_505566 [Cokeromyces recurvatus]|uniref:uncharacterized protein n=1 Tax=Cokeromyces recurvatus TaxID=90255 RepID=UPI002220D0AC|nr:uncharacterized protein BX663DRAFT_505566 [Cokeromyces recurvatus]KAI7903886.1 hypothetical protein BX663DRAFT_505566 [Cokeromyces recurvatus]